MKREIRFLEGGAEITFTARVSFICPCGLRVEVGRDNADVPLALHAEPRCAKFEQLELLEFLQWARENGARVVN